MTFSKSEITVLRETFLFQNLPYAVYEEITARWDLHFERRHLSTGQILTLPESGDHLLGVVSSGHLLEREPGRLPERVLKPGYIFGELDLFSRYPAQWPELQAQTVCDVLLFPASQIQDLFVRYPDIMRNFINFLTREIQTLRWENRLGGASTREKQLGQLLALYWKSSPEGYVVTLPYSLTALAERLQISRSSLYRMLDQLEASGVLRRNGKSITVLKPERLQ